MTFVEEKLSSGQKIVRLVEKKRETNKKTNLNNDIGYFKESEKKENTHIFLHVSNPEQNRIYLKFNHKKIERQKSTTHLVLEHMIY